MPAQVNGPEALVDGRRLYTLNTGTAEVMPVRKDQR